MPAQLRDNMTIVTWCDRCKATSTFNGHQAGSEFGKTPWEGDLSDPPLVIARFFRLYRCSGCERGGLAEIENLSGRSEEAPVNGAVLKHFYPSTVQTVALPDRTPGAVRYEFEEAEKCANAEAFRAGSAMLRSALEKALAANGYDERDLYKKIEAAASDGVITAARRQRAHDNIRSLGNDVVHDPWRPVDELEFFTAYVYTQRVIEDLYENRDEVLKILASKDRHVANEEGEEGEDGEATELGED